MSVWYRDATTEKYVCTLCALRAVRDAGMRLGRQRFEGTPEELLEHFRRHRDSTEWLHGDFLPPTNAPYDVFDDAELEPLRQLAIRAMSYDSSCEDLAAGFLADEPQATPYDRALLARHIQHAIEEWLDDAHRKGHL